jgi:hypothetical protein
LCSSNQITLALVILSLMKNTNPQKALDFEAHFKRLNFEWYENH